jgi:very-short-patch-repair endonuclease
LIVAGDQRQLPPTSFFELGLDSDDEWEEEQLDEFDSILDACKASGAFRGIPLRWHYRSQHEDLITYSNYSFYDGKLITFPGACAKADDLGMETFLVQGVYRRGGPRDNPVEAAKVVERVLHHTRTHPGLSIGVVALSEAQAATIEAVWERQRQSYPELPELSSEDPLAGAFVKNLETVQGDERDIIIFSIGYGPDESGRFTLSFGPINPSGGQRRLNVAITRARRRVEVVCSIRAGDIHEGTNSEGVRHLRRFLDFAAREENRAGALGLELGPSGRDVESPFEADVARLVRSWGFDVVPQVGCADYRIDLGVRHPQRPGEYALGVECDGAMYHSSRVARDRDRLRAEVLGRLGWKLHRIWGPSWYRERRREESRLRKAIEQAIEGVSPPPMKSPALAEPQPPVLAEPGPSAVRPAWVKPYVVCELPPTTSNFAMHESGAQMELRRLLIEVVRIEGPVHPEVALRRIRAAWGVGRAGSRIRAAFAGVVASLQARMSVGLDGFAKGGDGFLRMAGQDVSHVRTPSPNNPETLRNVGEVPPEEIGLALLSFAREALSIDSDELLVGVARLFGWDRLGAGISSRLSTHLEKLLRDKQLIRVNGRISPAGPS